MAREGRDEWAKRIGRWAVSGLTGAEFAAEIGVKESTLRHWKWLLAKGVRRSGPAPGAQRKVGFVEVITAKPVAQKAGWSATAPEPLQLVLAGGLRILVPAQFDATALRRLLDVVEAR